MSFHFLRFLITSLLLEEFGKKRQIDLLGFFREKFCVSLPVVLMVLVTMHFTSSSADYVAGIGVRLQVS